MKSAPSFLWLATFIAGAGFAKTEICGLIKYPSDWVRENSPYIITNDIYLPHNSRLRIEPGVVVRFRLPGECRDSTRQLDWPDSTYSCIKVDGAFFVHGKEGLPVIFEPEDFRAGKIGWDGIRMSGKSAFLAEIRHAVFRGANKALQVSDSKFTVSNTVFEWNNTGISLKAAANMKIANNNFIRNRSCGIFISGSNPFIVNNIFAENRNYGIWSDSRNAVDIKFNAFWNNTDAHCYHCPVGALKMNRLNANKDSVDGNFNLVADPLFIGTPSYHNRAAKDISLDTDSQQVLDASMAALEKEFRKKRPSPASDSGFKPLGKGNFLLSKYSKLRGAGNPAESYLNSDGTISDIGIHGGGSRVKND